MKLKVNDEVVIIAGKDKGKRGEITKVIPKKQRVIVKGMNTYRRHVKPTNEFAGGVVEIERALPASNVMLINPIDNKPSRVTIQRTETGEAIRVCKRTGKAIDSK